MNANSVQIQRTPFFGRYILETMNNKGRKETAEEKKKRNIKLQQIFEMIDDYVEQA